MSTSALLPPSPRRRLLGWLAAPATLLFPQVDPLTQPPDLSESSPSLTIGHTHIPSFDPADEARELRERVAKQFAAGAVDEGTPTVLDGRTSAVQDLREIRVRLDHLHRTAVMTRYMALLDARIASRDRAIDERLQAIAVIDRQLASMSQRQPGKDS